MKLQEIKVPKSLTCPACNAPITNAAPTRNTGQTFSKGMVILCSSCTTVLMVGDSDLRPMTADQINALSRESKTAILLTRQTLQKILEKRQKSRPAAN